MSSSCAVAVSTSWPPASNLTSAAALECFAAGARKQLLAAVPTHVWVRATRQEVWSVLLHVLFSTKSAFHAMVQWPPCYTASKARALNDNTRALERSAYRCTARQQGRIASSGLCSSGCTAVLPHWHKRQQNTRRPGCWQCGNVSIARIILQVWAHHCSI